EDHEGTLPDRLGAERPRIVLRGDRLVWVHPRDLHVAAGGDRLDAHLGLPAHPGPEPRTEADEELGHLDPERARDREVRGLVDHDHQDQGEEEGTDTERSHGAIVLPGLDDLGGTSSGPRVRPLEVHHRDYARGRLVLVDDGRDDLDDAREWDLALEEGHDRDLV